MSKPCAGAQPVSLPVGWACVCVCLRVCAHVHTPLYVCVCVQSSGQGRRSDAQAGGLGWMANLRLAEVPAQLCTWRDDKEGACFMGPSLRFPEALHDPTRAAAEPKQEGGREFLPVKRREPASSRLLGHRLW